MSIWNFSPSQKIQDLTQALFDSLPKWSPYTTTYSFGYDLDGVQFSKDHSDLWDFYLKHARVYTELNFQQPLESALIPAFLYQNSLNKFKIKTFEDFLNEYPFEDLDAHERYPHLYEYAQWKGVIITEAEMTDLWNKVFRV